MSKVLIRIGILGAARIAPPAILEPAKRREDCAVTAVAARDPARAAEFAAANGIPHTAESYEALFARQDVDLVYNALPPHRHADLTIAALEAGKPVLCEKPFAMNAAEARRMTAAADQAGLALIEAFHYRFHPAFSRALAIIRSGKIGEVRALKADFSVAIPFREGELRHYPELGGGALMDLGCYPLHWVRTVMDAEPEVVSARAELSEKGADLLTEAVLEFSGGVPARIRTSMKPGQRFKAFLAVQGTRGSLRYVNPVQPHRGHSLHVRRGMSRERLSLEAQTTYDYQLGHVMDVLAGRSPALTGGADAVANMALIDAIYSAAGVSRPA
jgi:predicted dehydrogenase